MGAGALLQRLQKRRGRAATPLDGLAAMFRAHVSFVIAHPGAPRIIFHELQQPTDSAGQAGSAGAAAGLPPAAAGSVRGWRSRAAELPAELEPKPRPRSLSASIQGLVMQSMLTGKPGAMKAQADRVRPLPSRHPGGAMKIPSNGAPARPGSAGRAADRRAGLRGHALRAAGADARDGHPGQPTAACRLRCSASARSRRAAAT